MRSIVFKLFIISLLLVPFSLLAANSLTISTLTAPIPTPTQHENILVYELHLVNPYSKAIRIGLIEILDENNKPLQSYSGNALIDNSFVYQRKNKIQSNEIILKKDMGAFIYVWIALPKDVKIPTQLIHKIWIGERNTAKGEAKVEVLEYPLAVNQDKPVELAFPLQGAFWIAAGAPSATSYHRRTILPLDNSFYLAQRYAIDWIQACPDGKGAIGDIRKNDNWLSFTHEVYAVADGEITSVKEGLAENTPPHFPSKLQPDEISGNRILLKMNQHGKDYYVLMAHMQPGSIRVKKGDRVKAGQLIGLLGNTGNSSAPHLHLHVCDNNDSLKCNGVPFIFKEISFLGKAMDVDPDYAIWYIPKQDSTLLKNIMPTFNEVFNFSEDLPKNCTQH